MDDILHDSNPNWPSYYRSHRAECVRATLKDQEEYARQIRGVYSALRNNPGDSDLCQRAEQLISKADKDLEKDLRNLRDSDRIW